MSARLRDCDEELKKVKSELRSIKTERRKRRAAAKARPRRPTARVAAAPPVGARLTAAALPPQQQVSIFDTVRDRVTQEIALRGTSAFEPKFGRLQPQVIVNPNPAQGLARGRTLETLESRTLTSGVEPPAREEVQITPRAPRAPVVAASSVPVRATGVSGLTDAELITARREQRKLVENTKAEVIGIQRRIPQETEQIQIKSIAKQKAAQNRLEKANVRLFKILRETDRRGLDAPQLSPMATASNTRQLASGRSPGIGTLPPKNTSLTPVVRQEDVDRRVSELMREGELMREQVERLREEGRRSPPPRVIRRRRRRRVVEEDDDE